MKFLMILMPAFLLSLCNYAQDWFAEYEQGDKIPGYILGIAGDTIEGSIQYDYPIIMQKRIYFFPEETRSDPITYGPDNIRGYSLAGKKWISTSVIMETYEGPYTFKRFAVVESNEGPVMLLRIYDERDKLKKKISSTEAEKDIDHIKLNFTTNSLDQLYIKKTDGEAEPLFTKDFKRSFPEKMKAFVGDHAELMQKIIQKEYTLKNIFPIVAEYNKWYKRKK